MSRLFLLFVAGMIFAAHSSLIPKDSLSELGEIDGEETADVPENEMPAEDEMDKNETELGEEDFDDEEHEDSDEMPGEGVEVEEGQPQEDTDDTVIALGEDAKLTRPYHPCHYRYLCNHCIFYRCAPHRRTRCGFQKCYGCRRFCYYG